MVKYHKHFLQIWNKTSLLSILPKLIFRYSTISVKIPSGFFPLDFDKLIINIYMEIKVKNSPKKELAPPNIKTYCKAIASKTVEVLVQGQTNIPVEENIEHRLIRVLSQMTKMALQDSGERSVFNKRGQDDWMIAIWRKS